MDDVGLRLLFTDVTVDSIQKFLEKNRIKDSELLNLDETFT